MEVLESVLLLLLRENEASEFMVYAEGEVWEALISTWQSSTGTRRGWLTLSEAVGDDNDWLL